PVLAFREFDFAAERVGRIRRARRLLAGYSARSPYQIRSVQLALAIPFSATGFVAAKLSARRGRARYRRPGSVVRQRARYHGWILIQHELMRANRAPVKDRRSFAGVGAIP